MKKRHLAALAALHLLFSIFYFAPRMREDSPYYFEHLRSAFFDTDLCFYNERTFTRPSLEGGRRHRFIRGPNEQGRPVTGGPNNTFDIGTTVMEILPFLGGHLAAKMAGLLGRPTEANGYSSPYILAMCLWFQLSALAATLLLYRIATRYAKPRLAFLAVALTVFGSFLPAYFYQDTLFSHLPSYVASVLTIFLLLEAGKQPRNATLFLLGAAFALLVMARRQNLLQLVLFIALLPAIATGERVVRRFLRMASVTLFGFLVFIFPELLVWKIEHGGFLSNPGMVTLRHRPIFAKVLLSDHGGLFSASPILLFGLAGILLLLRRRPCEGVPLLLAVLSQIVINALRRDWWPGLGFGNRRSDGIVAAFALGFALLLARLPRRGRRLVIAVGIMLLAWNMLALPQFYAGDKLMEKGSAFHLYQAHRSPRQARIRWPFPPLAKIPAIAREDASIVLHQSFFLAGERHAVPALFITLLVSVGAVLVFPRQRSQGPLGSRLAVAGTFLYALSLTIWLIHVAWNQAPRAALFYDRNEPPEVLQLSRDSSFQGGRDPLLLPSSTSRSFQVPPGGPYRALEIVISEPSVACLTLPSGRRLEIQGGEGSALTFPAPSRHVEIPLATPITGGTVSVAGCGTSPAELFGLALVP